MSLKNVLPHNGIIYGSIPIRHSMTMKKEYANIKVELERLNYRDQEWLICVDMKMVNIILELQRRLHQIAYHYFLCYWDSKAKEEHWVRKEWPSRNSLIPGDKDMVVTEPSSLRLEDIFPKRKESLHGDTGRN